MGFWRQNRRSHLSWQALSRRQRFLEILEAAPTAVDWVTESLLAQNWRVSTTRRLERWESETIWRVQWPTTECFNHPPNSTIFCCNAFPLFNMSKATGNQCISSPDSQCICRP